MLFARNTRFVIPLALRNALLIRSHAFHIRIRLHYVAVIGQLINGQLATFITVVHNKLII